MSIATDMLALYYAAEAAVLEGKEAKIGDRSFRSEDLSQIIAGRKEWEAKVRAERGGGNTIGGLGMAVARLDR